MAIKLIQGDCREALQKMKSGTIDLTVTSPPYDNLRTYNGNNKQWGEHVWKSVLVELFRVTKQGGVVVWVVGDATINGSETGTSFKQALWAMDCGFNLHDTMIWEKPSFTATGALRVRYAQVFEYMFIFTIGTPQKFNPIKDRKCIMAAPIHGTVRKPDGTMKKQSTQGKVYGNKPAQRFNIWRMNPVLSNNLRCHPAQFPEQLAYDHIISWSNKGDTVLDCFMGSGTTGVASIKSGRDFIGIELDEEYFKIAEKRIHNADEPFLFKI